MTLGWPGARTVWFMYSLSGYFELCRLRKWRVPALILLTSQWMCIKEEKQLCRSGVISMEHFTCWRNNLALWPAKHGMRKGPWNAFVYPSDCTGSFNRALCASVDIQRERLCAFVRARMFVCALLFEVVWTMKQNKRLGRKKRLLSR